MKRERQVLTLLKKNYPGARTALDYANPHEILFATILSAQCTDKRVNQVTRELFRKYKTVEDYANAKQEEFEKDIKSTGFYRNKASNIIASAKKILRDFGGRVPDKMDSLLALPGVARKTANIVLWNAYGRIEGIAVDTHVLRVSYRLGLTSNTLPAKVEQDLMKLYPKNEWPHITNLLISHGREVCRAPNPYCSKCFLVKLCPKNGVKKQL